MCVYVSVCLCVCLGYNFEWVDIETSYLVWCYILTISRSFQYQGHWVKVILWKMLILLPGHHFNLVWLVWGQGHKWGQCHLKVKVISSSNCKCLTFYWQTGGGSSTERHSFLYKCLKFNMHGMHSRYCVLCNALMACLQLFLCLFVRWRKDSFWRQICLRPKRWWGRSSCQFSKALRLWTNLCRHKCGSRTLWEKQNIYNISICSDTTRQVF